MLTASCLRWGEMGAGAWPIWAPFSTPLDPLTSLSTKFSSDMLRFWFVYSISNLLVVLNETVKCDFFSLMLIDDLQVKNTPECCNGHWHRRMGFPYGQPLCWACWASCVALHFLEGLLSFSSFFLLCIGFVWLVLWLGSKPQASWVSSWLDEMFSKTLEPLVLYFLERPVRSKPDSKLMTDLN